MQFTVHELLFPLFLIATQFLPPVRALYARSIYRFLGNVKKYEELSRITQRNADSMIAVGKRFHSFFVVRSDFHKGKYREIGSIGNITAIHAKMQQSQGKSSRKTRSKGPESKSGSKGDNSSDPDPDSELRISPVYSYATVAELGDISVKTLRNKVSSGLIPRPIKTPIGARFTAEQVLQILGYLPLPSQTVPKSRRRGRPRIVDLRGRGGEG